MGFNADPYSELGRLANEIWRAIRLVVDTGIHAKGWTQQQAEAYFLANSPQPAAAAQDEIERYILRPGQATRYKLGMIVMQRLQEEARAALGSSFDYRRFHGAMLDGGALPLPVLETRVRRWIEREKSQTLPSSLLRSARTRADVAELKLQTFSMQQEPCDGR